MVAYMYAYAAKMPSAMLYVDLRSAFHSFLRELALGAGLGGPTDLRALQQTLDQEGFEEEIIAKVIQTHGVLPDGALKALMRDLHGFTWSTIQGKGVYCSWLSTGQSFGRCAVSLFDEPHRQTD